MNRLRSLWQTLKYFALSAIFWLALYGTVLAKKAPEEAKKDKEPGWVLAYFLVMMGIVLGMLVVCRSSRRRERAFLEKDEETTEKRVSQAEMVEEEARKKKETGEQSEPRY